MIRALVCTAFGALLLAACGDDDDTFDSFDASAGSDAAVSVDTGVSPDGDTSGDDSQVGDDDAATADANVGPSGHTDIQQGVAHATGKEDPLANCTTCHGTDLKGGASGQSCYDCHNNNDHTSNREGVSHLSGANSSCATCHGPNNTGGLGPACSKCHN